MEVHLIDHEYIANPEYTMSGAVQIIATGPKENRTYQHNCLSCGAGLCSSGIEPWYVRHNPGCDGKGEIHGDKAEAAFKGTVKLNKKIAELNIRAATWQDNRTEKE